MLGLLLCLCWLLASRNGKQQILTKEWLCLGVLVLHGEGNTAKTNLSVRGKMNYFKISVPLSRLSLGFKKSCFHFIVLYMLCRLVLKQILSPSMQEADPHTELRYLTLNKSNTVTALHRKGSWVANPQSQHHGCQNFSLVTQFSNHRH